MATVERLSISMLFCGFTLGIYSRDKPNIVIYIADDHGCMQSEPYGDMFVKTPNMGKLADDGMVFDNAFVVSPASGPSRAALLSGLMPSRNGAEVNHTLPDASTQRLVKMIQEQGYEVAAIGKIAHSKKHAVMNGFDYCDMPMENLRDKIKVRVKKIS